MAPLTSWDRLQACGSGDNEGHISRDTRSSLLYAARHLSTELLGSRRGCRVSDTKVSGGGGTSLRTPLGPAEEVYLDSALCVA